MENSMNCFSSWNKKIEEQTITKKQKQKKEKNKFHKDLKKKAKKVPHYKWQRTCCCWHINLKNHKYIQCLVRLLKTQLFNSFKLCLMQVPTLTDWWSFVRSRILTDVCDFTWKDKKCKEHKSGSKQKLVHFPLCSLPWINDAMIWAGFVAFGGGFSTACVTGTLSSKQNGKILTKVQFNFLSLQSMYNYLTECIVSGSPSSKTFLK